ncbi:MAG: hypothetical protein FWC42_09760 [Proteobacteria bacterium]|nr:hypothetical protein [Pseudomonadota bacterium]
MNILNIFRTKKADTTAITKQSLLERFGGIALDKQSNLAEIIGDRNWSADTEKGEIRFGDDLAFPMQVLGTFSHSSETWLWAWANPQAAFSQHVLTQANDLKKYGDELSIDFLTTEKFDATMNDAHIIGMIASGFFKTSCYYVGDFGDGAVVVTIRDKAIDNIPSIDKARIPATFSRLISHFEMNHKNAFICYLKEKDFVVEADGGNTVTGIKGKDKITATFDELSRLTNLKA